MNSIIKLVGIALVGAFVIAPFNSPSEAREQSGLRQSRHHVKKTPMRHRVAQRPSVPAVAAPIVASRAGGPDPRAPYSGPGRAQFEPVVVGAQPDRADGRTPEGP